MNGGGGEIEAFRAWSASQPVSAGTRGMESLVEGVVSAVPKRAWLLPGRRERGAAVLRGADPARMDEARPYKVVPPGASPAIRALEAVGIAIAGEPAVVFLGTGSTSYGAFHEALHLAATHSAPVIFVISWYAGDGPFARQLAIAPAALASALGVGATTCDGASAESVRDAVARVGLGPAVVVAEMPHG